MELGFFETNINGREVIAHLGDTDWFHTSLHLFLKENVGFYVSFNSPGKDGAAGRRCATRCSRISPTATSRPPCRNRDRAGRCEDRGGARGALSGALGKFARLAVEFPGRRSASSARPRWGSTRRASSSLPFPGLERQAAPLGRDRTLRVAGRGRSRPRWPPKWSMARRCASASTSCRPSWCSTARRGMRAAAWLLPLLLRELRSAAADRAALAGHGDRAPPLRRAARARSGIAARLSLEPHRGDR